LDALRAWGRKEVTPMLIRLFILLASIVTAAAMANFPGSGGP
jgi:hypothetical protein